MRLLKCDAAGEIHPIDDSVNDSLVALLFFSKIDERLTNLTAAQGKTCRWFLTKPEYVAWRHMAGNSEDCGFLWIKGNPGTGKSTLMKLLFEDTILGTKHDPLRITLSFFFLARGTLEEKSTTGLYRSILHQLFDKAVDLKESLGWMTPDGAKGILHNGWHDQALKQTLKYAVSKLGKRSLTIFVDALDECDESQTTGMVCFFEELCDHAKDMGVQLRICFSSRHYPTIVIERGVEITLEAEPGHEDDIKQYIESRLRLGKTKQAESLRAEILAKSSRIFLWVVLVLDILNAEYPNSSVSINEIRRRLEEMPPGLDELFEKIIARDRKNLDQLHVCLKWVLFAIRPLKPQEFYFAVQLGLDGKSSTYWDQEDIELDQMKMFVRTSTKGLAEVTRTKASEVQFIHESVRDFLLGRYGGQWSGLSGSFEGHSHNMLRDCCLFQLNADVHQRVEIPDSLPQGAEGAKLREDLHLKFPFLAYSVFSVLPHADSAQHYGVQQGNFLATFPVPQWVALNNAFERYPSRRYKTSVSLLYLLAENNLANLIRIHPQALSCFDVEQERYGTPIFAALTTESNKAIESFVGVYLEKELAESPLRSLCEQWPKSLKKCSTITRSFTFSQRLSVLPYILEEDSEGLFAFFFSLRLRNSPYKEERSILSFAAEKGYKSVVKLLLATEGCNSDDSEGRFGWTPLFWAAREGHETIVQLLLDNGANIESRDQDGRTPLTLAVRQGHETIARVLLDNGANIESKDKDGLTLLSLAVQYNHKTMVQLLLDKDANTESKDKDGQTALSWAAEYGNKTSAQLLLDNGADIESKSKNGLTPLSRAVWKGHKTIAQLLLDNGANIESKENNGLTPLGVAVRGGQETTTQLLLDKGANIESRDKDGKTPLLYAAAEGQASAAQLLLEKGNANIDATDNDGKMALAWAASRGKEATVRLLIEKSDNTNIDSRDNWGRTPLSHAADMGFIDIVRLLLDNNANPNSKDFNGCTPLSYVVNRRFPVVDRTLDDYEIQLILLEQQNKMLLMMAREGWEGAGRPVALQRPDNVVEIVALRSHRHSVVAELLLQWGADIESFGEGLLHYAAQKGLENMVRLLLATGRVDVNAKDLTDQTPLSLALENGYEAVVKLLVDAGASVMTQVTTGPRANQVSTKDGSRPRNT